jgi:hypothetical protein
VIGTLCECLDTLDESEAKASMIWVVGEYAERIDNAAELLDNFMETVLHHLLPPAHKTHILFLSFRRRMPLLRTNQPFSGHKLVLAKLLLCSFLLA